jgi:predicted nucleotidyltransferase
MEIIAHMADAPIGKSEPKGESDLSTIMGILRAAMPGLRQQFGVMALGVFGSYVRGDQRTGSDLDVLVEFDRPISLLGFVDLEKRISELLGVKVDLVMKSALKPNIGRRILREVVPV